MTDDLIDLVARDLTATPAPDLARAVRARIAATPERHVWPRRLATLTLISATAVIVVLVLRTSPAPPTSIVAVAPPAAPSPYAASPAAPAATGTRSTSRACPEPCRRAARVRPITQVELEWQSRAIPALVPSAPLTIDPIQPDRLSIPLMQVEPIELTPVGAAGGR